MFKNLFHSFKLELHINILFLNSELQFNACPLIFHVQSMYLWTKVLRRCHKRACTETFPHGSMDTVEEAVPALGLQGVWNHRFGGWLGAKTGHMRAQDLDTVLSSQGGETVDLTFLFPSFVLFLRLSVSVYSNQTNVSARLQTFAACLRL